MVRYPLFVGSAWLWVGAVLCCVGCGTGAYEERMAATYQKLNSAPTFRVKLSEMYGYMPEGDALAGGKVNLRLPMVFEKVFNESTKGENGIPIEPQKLFPAGVKLPGYNRTYEALAKDDAQAEWPYYLYVAAQAAPEGSVDQHAAELLAALKEKAPTTPDAWENVELPTPEGAVLKWKKLRIVDEFMTDHFDPQGNQGYAKFPGVIELYLLEQDGCQVILGWRAVAATEEPTLVADRVKLAAGTLQINGKSPVAAP